MIDGIHKILKDPQCAGNIKSAMWAMVVVCLYFSFMLYGFAVLEALTVDIKKSWETDCRISQLEKVTYSIFYPGESQCTNLPAR